MAYEHRIVPLHEGAVLAECGPMRLVISSFVGGIAQREMNVRAARASVGFLERVASAQERLRRPWNDPPGDLCEPLARKMAQSAAAVGDPELTPMAAVAGTIADAVADYLLDRGMTKVVVSNGGDVAVRLRGTHTVRVGLRTDLRRDDCPLVLLLDSSRTSWGIATSGLGGRSLTRGIASAATVVAKDASTADAAATAVANTSFVDAPGVIRRPAEDIDPLTDIAGLPVTVEVGALDEATAREGVARALARASGLVETGVILGACVAVDGRTGMTDFFRSRTVE